MPKNFLPVVLILLVSASIFGQVVTSTPKPPSTNDSDVVKITTNLIQLDVTVTDKKGNAIRDLRPEEIEVYENGKRQKISNFSFVPGTRPLTTTPVEKAKQPVINLPAAPVRPEQVRRTIALVVDDLTLSFESIFWVREALTKFVNEQMLDGDLVAIIRTGAGVGALQQFTTDKRQLLLAIEKVKFNLSGAGRTGSFAPIEQSLSEQLNGGTDSQGETKDFSQDIAREQALARDANEFRENIFANGTLGALNFIVRGMRDLPGRKSVMLLSDGLRLVTRDDRGVPQPTRIIDRLKNLIDLANRASVIFYTLDVRGLVAYGPTAQDNITDIFDPVTDRKLNDRINELADTQDGLRYLANATGGLAILNQNNISKGIRRVLDDQSYYLVGYEPDDETFDLKTHRYNKMEIRVNRPGLRTRYRSGFFAVASENLTKPKLDTKTSLLNALTSPFAVNDVAVRMNALFVNDAKAGSSVRAFINVDAKDLVFTKLPDGNYRVEFDLVALTFGDNGTILDERSRSYSVTVNQANYEKMLLKGLASSFTVPIKKPGAYQVRLAFSDKVSEKVGSANQFIQVPSLGKKKLSVSGPILVSLPYEKFKNLHSIPQDELSNLMDPAFDTSVRQFKLGNVLRFDYEIYNTKRNSSGKVNLSYQLTLYRENQVAFKGEPKPLVSVEDGSASAVEASGSIHLIPSLLPGDYVLRIEITDILSHDRLNRVEQFVQFQILK